ncbi:MAG: 4Fe-4S dicluster domain-containing protein [Solimonas sp.]
MRRSRHLRDRGNPGCKSEPGLFVPRIDPLRCSAEGPCVRVCPYDVLELREVPADQRRAYPWLLRLRLAVKGGRQAAVVRAAACHACGDCVVACPEQAITLVRATPTAAI